jgi:hypothetical protein
MFFDQRLSGTASFNSSLVIPDWWFEEMLAIDDHFIFLDP